jgi:formate hydrogenlyase subunit 4
MINITYILVQIIVILLLAPLINGIILKIKAFTQKRKGAPLFQMYFDLFKLFRKNNVVSDVSSWIFKVTPYIVFSTAIAAALLVPVTTLIVPDLFFGDSIMLVSILALGRFFMMLAALDTQITFGGMGSSREVMISALIEPSILVSLFTIGLISNSTTVYSMMKVIKNTGKHGFEPVYIVIFLSFIIVIIAETSRIPVDDPATHLELTMVHEAMVLEYSGRHLALMEYSAVIKQLVFITLMANVLIPHDQLIAFTGIGAIILSLIIYLIKVVLITAVIAFIEVNTVKFRLLSVPNLAALSFIVALLGFLQYFIFGGRNV